MVNGQKHIFFHIIFSEYIYIIFFPCVSFYINFFVRVFFYYFYFYFFLLILSIRITFNEIKYGSLTQYPVSMLQRHQALVCMGVSGLRRFCSSPAVFRVRPGRLYCRGPWHLLRIWVWV